MATAQADYRANDRDGNGKNDYWRKDVAGLYALPGRDGDMIKLIEPSMVTADDRPTFAVETYGRRGPRLGYWYRALRFRGETTPDPEPFAACAYPDSVSAGRVLFITSHENRVYKKPFTGGPPPEEYPDPETLKREWSVLD